MNKEYIILERRYPLEFEINNMEKELEKKDIFIKSSIPINQKGLKVHYEIKFILTFDKIKLFNEIEEKYVNKYEEYSNTFLGKLNSFF